MAGLALALGSGPALAAPDSWSSLIKAAKQAQERGRWDQAEPALLKALLEAESFEDTDPRLAYTLDYLGMAYRANGKKDEALKAFQRSYAAFETALGPNSQESAMSSIRVAQAAEEAGAWDVAEVLWRARVSEQRKLGGDALALAELLNSLGVSVDAQQRQDEALSYYSEALSLRESKLGTEAVELSEVLNNQARVYYMKGDLGRSEDLFRRAISIDSKALGEKHPLVAEDYRRLAPVLRKAGKGTEADALEAQAAAIEKPKAKPKAKPKPKKKG